MIRIPRSTFLVSLVGLCACGDDASDWRDIIPPHADAADVGPQGDASADSSESKDAALDAKQDGPVVDSSLEGGKESGPEAAAESGPEGSSGPSGFIGSPCQTSADCKFENAVCLTSGFPGGTCTLACTSTCPDRDGYPVTFCADASAVPEASTMQDGLCLSRCDLGIFPDSGCREGYGCVKVARPSDANNIKFACLPNRQSELSQCYLDLAKRGVALEPSVMQDEHPDTHPTLTCHIEDPLYLKSPIHGVELRTSSGTVTERVLAACKMANALVSTVDDLAPLDVIAIRHMGTYNCRVVAGTDKLSEHAGAEAIDLAGFDFKNGNLYTVVGDWEHDDSTPETEGGKFLYSAAHRWFDNKIWNTILTPNYNEAHDDHFHVDMKAGAHYIGFTDGRYIGPAPYND